MPCPFLQEQGNFDDLKSCAAEHNKSPAGGRTCGGSGGVGSMCSPLEAPAGGNTWECTRRDLRYSVPDRKHIEDSSLLQTQRGKGPVDGCKRGCWPGDSAFKGHQKNMDHEEGVPWCLRDLHALANGKGTGQETEENKRLLSCVVSLLKMIQEKEASDRGGVQGAAECAGTNAALSTYGASQPADDTAEPYYPQTMALWNMARLAA